MKTLILYAFHQFNNRVQYFIDHAIFEDDNFDFIIICNDRNINISVPDFVSVINRDNIGYDFGAWSEGLLTGDRYKQYENFIFLNSSVIGPYLPDGYTKQWPYRFLDGLTDNIKLFGSTINAFENSHSAIHVQSFAYCMQQKTVEYLVSKGIFSLMTFSKNFESAIWNYEVRMSREIIAAGWNIGSLMHNYDGVDFTFIDKTPAEYNISWHGDIMFPNTEIDRKEVMFVKGNRGFAI